MARVIKLVAIDMYGMTYIGEKSQGRNASWIGIRNYVVVATADLASPKQISFTTRAEHEYAYSIRKKDSGLIEFERSRVVVHQLNEPLNRGCN